MTLEDLLGRVAGGDVFTGATLSRPRRSDPAVPQHISADPVLVRGQERVTDMLSVLESRRATVAG